MWMKNRECDDHDRENTMMMKERVRDRQRERKTRRQGVGAREKTGVEGVDQQQVWRVQIGYDIPPFSRVIL